MLTTDQNDALFVTVIIAAGLLLGTVVGLISKLM